ncbi:MAG: ferric reductase-like transmembrane domain-containing protein [Alphaproteobacteria bacterium]|nr:ferric reductase-like transmembrane domain-containing protein [Alphaproteobacteria bacterium]
MAATYKPVIWNRHKRIYDLALVSGIALYLTVFVGVGMAMPDSANTSIEILLISALGACAFFMIHVVLAIGPLARLSTKFLPLLYNRRHVGVALFLVALSHGAYATIWYHGFGVLNPIVSLFVSNPRYDAINAFPFESLGVAALAILFLLASTSHDFWLNNLSPAVWKTLHMLIYPAYGAMVMHVLLGAASGHGGSPLYVWATAGGFALISGLHIAAALVQTSRDRAVTKQKDGDWIDAGPFADIPEKRARIVAIGGTSIAIFRYDGKLSAISNFCAHQMGPLGEGCLIDGLVTCPWHGWQYDPATGRSPAPYTEKVETFAVRIKDGHVFVNAIPNAKGTPVAPTMIG